MKTKRLYFLALITGCFAADVEIREGKANAQNNLGSANKSTTVNEPINATGLRTDSLIADKAERLGAPDVSPTVVKAVSGPQLTEGKYVNTTNNIVPPQEEMISEQQARTIASEAVSNIAYDKVAEISIHREAGCYVVTFPIKKPELKQGERYRGAQYAAKVLVDEKTGKIIQIKVGS